MSAIEVVQRQLDAYNAQDLEAFIACFAPDCVIADLHGAVTQQGIDAIRARYAKLFAEFPDNHARLVNRIAVGNVVVDHEDITRAAGARFQAAAIYTVRDGRIARVDFVRET
jgi:uncharacterized protein (TIGR02246 family)